MVIVAHSLGIPTVINAIPDFGKPVAGAFLVAPPDVANAAIRPKHLMTFGPYPRDPLPFPSVTIGSRNDPFCAFDVAEDIAAAWGSLFIDAGEAGHINAEFRLWPVAGRLDGLRAVPVAAVSVRATSSQRRFRRAKHDFRAARDELMLGAAWQTAGSPCRPAAAPSWGR